MHNNKKFIRLIFIFVKFTSLFINKAFDSSGTRIQTAEDLCRKGRKRFNTLLCPQRG